MASVVLDDACVDQGEAAGNQRRRTDTLHQPGADQPADGRGQTAGERSCGENDQPSDKDPATAVAVACRAPGEQQRTQRQEVAVENPLLVRQTRIQFPPDRR